MFPQTNDIHPVVPGHVEVVSLLANAQGGTIYIGIDDAGNVIGVKDVKKLMEDIPNKEDLDALLKLYLF